MKLVISFLFLMISFLTLADEQEAKIIERLKKRGIEVSFVYHPEWIALYTFDGKNRITKVNNDHEWKVPHHDCILGPVQNSSPETFSRTVTCAGKNLGAVGCASSGKSTSCEKDFGEVTVVLNIKKYPSMGTRRAIELEFEKDNKIPY